MFIYAIVRNSLQPAHVCIQSGHAVSEAASHWTFNHDAEISPEAHLGVVTATKAQLQSIRDALDAAGVAYKAIVETAGPLTGVTTAIGIVTEDKERLLAQVPLLDTLPKFK